MTPYQLDILATHIRASSDQAVIDALSIRNDTELARLYNLPSAVTVWRTEIPVPEYRDALVWTEVDGLTAGKARIWQWLTADNTLPLESGKAAVRQGLADAWGATTATRGQLLTIATRLATLAESLYVTGTNGTKDLTFDGLVTITDIGEALNNY